MLILCQMNPVILSNRNTECQLVITGKVLHAQINRLVRLACVYLDEELAWIGVGGLFRIDSDPVSGRDADAIR